uniref:hypothetical protein n=1 Tax=Hydrocytium acuminatum TaxID=1745963 RepID=UPI002A83A29F|nr:hypothetical protein UYM18_pgp110 [Hydrocytium acuminatum]WOR09510.1 hypothetical protein [Hydrocytium acuminatum]
MYRDMADSKKRNDNLNSFNQLRQNLTSIFTFLMNTLQTYSLKYEKIEENNELLKNINKASNSASGSLEALQVQNIQMSKKLDTITEQNKQLAERLLAQDKLAAEKEELKRLAKEKRLNRVKQPLRDGLSIEEFYVLITMITKGMTPLINARDRISFLLLYVFGWRVSQLNRLTLHELSQFVEGKTIRIELIKSEATVKKEAVLYPTASYREYMKAFKPETDIVLGEGSGQKLFYPTTREYTTKRLNTYLKELSKKVQKHLTTHSLRVSVISNIVQAYGIEKARQYIGHKRIESTQYYNRYTISEKEHAEMQANIFKHVPTDIKLQENIKEKPKKDLTVEYLKKKMLNQKVSKENFISSQKRIEPTED